MSEAELCECGCGDRPANRYASFIRGHRALVDSTEERFHASYRVEDNGCWVWTANLDTNGYGRISPTGSRRVMLAHRYSLSLVEPLVEGLEVDHLCRNTACVNPSHLEQVTGAENKRRAMQARPRVSQCKRGHDYDEGNTFVNGNGYRECRTCRLANQRARNGKEARA